MCKVDDISKSSDGEKILVGRRKILVSPEMGDILKGGLSTSRCGANYSRSRTLKSEYYSLQEQVL